MLIISLNIEDFTCIKAYSIGAAFKPKWIVATEFFKKFIEIYKKQSYGRYFLCAVAVHFQNRGIIHKLFTEFPFFPLAFLRGLCYSILALGSIEC